MRCPQCGKEWPETFKGCPECVVPLVSSPAPPAEAPPPPPDLPALRARLERLDDPQIEALALDGFPEVKAKFSAEMGRDVKVNLLLDHCRRWPETVPALVRWLDRQPATCDDATVLPCYLARVIAENAQLQLQGICSASGLVSIDLEEIYITLTATVRKTVRDEAAWLAEQARLAPGEAQRMNLERPRESGQQVKVPVQEALQMHPRLVVLGDPGSGKTTLLHYLALTYARDWMEQAPDDTPGVQRETSNVQWVKARLGLDEHRLPILLPLRNFAGGAGSLLSREIGLTA